MGDVATTTAIDDDHGEGGAVHGVYSRAELEALGLDAREIRRMVAAGELEIVRRGWYATPAHDDRVHAAVKAGGVLSCVSALRRHGFWLPPGYPEDHRRIARNAKADSGCRGFSPLAAGRVGVDPVVIALECAARCMREEDWIAVCDSVLNTWNVSAEELRGRMGHLPKYVVAMFGKTDVNSQSGTESIARVRLRALHFSVVVRPQIADVGRTDLRIGRILIECDSRQHHASLESYQNDRTRDRKAVVGRWITLRLTYDDILFGWDEVVEDIRAITAKDRHRHRPVVKYGTESESTHNPAQINEWWQANPDYGIALHVGRSGAIAFDLDRDDLAELPRDMAEALRLGVFQSSRCGISNRAHYVFANGGTEMNALASMSAEASAENVVTLLG